MSVYDLTDWLTTSPIEGARYDYKTVLRDTQDSADRIRGDIDELYFALNHDCPMFYGANSGDASSGQVVADFEAAVVRWKLSVDGLISPSGVFYQEVVDLEAKEDVLRRRQNTLDQMCVEEDEREKEYTLDDIPF